MFAHGDGGPEPEWVKTEREQFSDFRDLNKDGKMDADEIRHWIMPQDYDHAQAEARHLVYESDKDKVPWFTCVTSGPAVVHQVSDLTTFCFQDQMLTKEEILDNWNMFVGSQATNYGEDLTRNHDELWALCVCVPKHRRACVWERERKDTCEDCEQHSSFPHIVGTDVSETSTRDKRRIPRSAPLMTLKRPR